MSNHGSTYTPQEVALLDWVSKKINSVQEMTEIAPVIAEILDRGESAIRQQIEKGKQDAGFKNFFWANT
ncbi:hypothetical protein [Paenibacillus sp. FSL E2-0178]|uniref:hypothetical protein n=1 Tax=Paenibacillus sp. FSL E2-0178 TaxID=2921361 RepID=UPI00315961F4